MRILEDLLVLGFLGETGRDLHDASTSGIVLLLSSSCLASEVYEAAFFTPRGGLSDISANRQTPTLIRLGAQSFTLTKLQFYKNYESGRRNVDNT